MRVFVKSPNLILLSIFCLPPSLAFPREANIGKRSPDQVLVVFNANSPVSCAIADDYARKRNVKNMLSIQCQDSALNAKSETITWAAYTQSIENRVREYLEAHTNIDFIVLTKGVPIRIAGAPMGSSDQIGGLNYSGQGAYADPGHGYWNPIKYQGTTSNGLLSDGVTASPITFMDTSPNSYDGNQGVQGTPAGLESPYAFVNNDSIISETIKNVPAGIYQLYLYGKNDDMDYADRGTVFTVSVDGKSYGTKSTVNSVTTSFTRGNDFVEFTNLMVGQAGTITFTYAANTLATRTHSPQTEGDFNGLQLVCAGAKTINFDMPGVNSLEPASIRGRPSVDSTLAALDYANLTEAMKINITGSGATGLAYSNRYWNAAEPFSHAKFGGYLVTRLDGYTEADAKGLVTKSLEAEHGLVDGEVLFDVQPIFGLGDKTAQPAPITGTNILRESPWDQYNADMRHAHDLLVKRGITNELDLSPTFIGGRSNLLGYFSWGSNDARYSSEAYQTLFFAPGSLSDTAVSTCARTFLPTQGGQSLLVDLVAHGLTCGKGYVDEPLLQANASPTIVMDRYTSGYTMAESFYAASHFVGWEDVIIGDPLCSPYLKNSMPLAPKP